MRTDLARIARNPALLCGLLGMLVVLLIALFGSALAPQDPNAQHTALFEPGSNKLLFPPTGPDRAHLLGTDPLGRDQLSRILVGARTSVTVVLLAVLTRLSIGITLGIGAAWFGRAIAQALSLVTAAFAAVPQLLLAVLFVLVLRPFGIAGFIVALAVIGWPGIAEFVRLEVARARTSTFMEAARSLGGSDARLLRTHVLTAIAPSLLTLAALEMGGLLLLLAELGLVGLFLAGATYYLNENGLPVMPLRDRAPEWGQMLGGIQFYAIQEQIVVLIPAAVIVLFAVVFTLLADGLRVAGDPFGTGRLLPKTYGAIAKGLGATLCVSALGFAFLDVRPAAMSLTEGRAVAAATAERTWPGSVFAAAAAHYTSTAHGMERPERLTYYFENASGEVLRISFLNADRAAIEVRPYESEDGIDFSLVRPIPMATIDYAQALAGADDAGGARWRFAAPTYLVRVTLTWPRDQSVPVYSVSYGTETGQEALRVCCYDATTGEFMAPPTAAAPFPIPASCAATAFAPAPYLDPRGFGLGGPGVDQSAWYRVMSSRSSTTQLGSFSPLFYEGDNEIVVEGADGPPRVDTATREGASAQAEVARLETMAAGAYDASLRFAAPGCWKLRLSAGTTPFELTVYAYPATCRPRGGAVTPPGCRP